MTSKRRGTCQVCAREFDLKENGRVRHHLMPKRPNNWYRSPVCQGANQPPLPTDTTGGES